MAKNIQPASTYAPPHTMSGKKVSVQTEKVYKSGDTLDDLNISVGNLTNKYKPENPYGVGEMRGYGAATKGRKISGKMG